MCSRLTIPACIGCGAMRKDQTCPVACAERKVDLVNAGITTGWARPRRLAAPVSAGSGPLSRN